MLKHHEERLTAAAVFGYTADAYLHIEVRFLEEAVETLLSRGVSTIGDLRVLGYYLDAVPTNMVAGRFVTAVNEAVLTAVRNLLRVSGGRVTLAMTDVLSGSWALQDMLENLLQNPSLPAQALGDGKKASPVVH